MAAPAAVSWAATTGRIHLASFPYCLLDTTRVARTTRKLALGEIISDKTPIAPSRLKPASLTWRLISGGVCGAALSTSDGGDAGRGAALGATGALVGSLLGYAWRTRARQRLHAPDFPLALLEDMVAVGSAAVLVSCSSRAGARDGWADVDSPAWLP